jgi:hypothetical protein
MTTKKKKSPEYQAKIKVLGRVYESKGKDVKDVIEKLKPLGKCAGMSILSIKKGNISKERILTHAQTTRLFALSPLTREIAIKNISLTFSL